MVSLTTLQQQVHRARAKRVARWPEVPAFTFGVGMILPPQDLERRVEYSTTAVDLALETAITPTRFLDPAPFLTVSISLVFLDHESEPMPRLHFAPRRGRSKYANLVIWARAPVIRRHRRPWFITDLHRACLLALGALAERHGLDPRPVERELAKLPPPRGETAFDGLLDGPTEREIERGLPPEQRPGFEVVLRVPLRHGAFGADDERDAMDRLDGRLERGMSKSKAGMLETREIGGGCAEFFITGPREGPLVRAVRGCLKGVDLPPRTRARVRKEGSAGRGKPVTM